MSSQPGPGAFKSSLSEVIVRAPRRLGWIDLTDDLRRAVKDSGITEGCAVAFTTHTTCSLVINEWEDGSLEDLERSLETLVPPDRYYAHDDMSRRTLNLQPEERVNGRSHVIAMILGGASQTVPVACGEPMFGQWQRLLLFELDEPKDRKCIIKVWGD
jgi:secondary thiamine-phosphate synthase enzyme